MLCILASTFEHFSGIFRPFAFTEISLKEIFLFVDLGASILIEDVSILNRSLPWEGSNRGYRGQVEGGGPGKGRRVSWWVQEVWG